MSPRFFLLCLLSLGVCQSGGASSDKKRLQGNLAITVYDVQISAIMDAYNSHDQVLLNHLMHPSEVRVPIYYLPNVELLVAKFQTNTMMYAFGKFNNEIYVAKVERSETSPTGYFMSYMSRCEGEDC